jgi:hypothetical protein
MENIDALILKIVEQRFPGDLLDLAQIETVVWDKLEANQRIEVARGAIRRRIKFIIKHGSIQPNIPGLFDAYPTGEKGILIKRDAMTHEQANWALTQLDRAAKDSARRFAVRRNALTSWMSQRFGVVVAFKDRK